MAKQDTQKGLTVLTLPIAESTYARFLSDASFARQQLDELIQEYPELFPTDIKMGYSLNGNSRPLKKMNGLRLRQLIIQGRYYRLRPSWILPYGRGHTQIAAKALLMVRFGLPFWVVALVLGGNAMYYYRLYLSLSQLPLLSTVLQQEHMPQHVLADEHHIRIRRTKAYVSTVVGKGCILGIDVVYQASTQALKTSYGRLIRALRQRWPTFRLLSVNTDGWQATQRAWRELCPHIAVLECLLHAFLKVRDRASKKALDVYCHAADKIWSIYRSPSRASRAQYIRHLKAWAQAYLAQKQCPVRAMFDNVIKFCNKKDRWQQHIGQQPGAHLTSNALDRLMKFMSAHARNSQMFHSNLNATQRNWHAFALLHNFCPSCPTTQRKYGPEWDSPAARLNQFKYADNWLENLLLSASHAQLQHHCNPLE